MATHHYNKQILKKAALRHIHRFKYIRLNEVIKSSIASKNVWFDYGLNKDEDILEALENNKEDIKKDLRDNWKDPKANPILQIGLYKLLGDDEEKRALGVTAPAQTNVHINVQNVKELSDDDLERLVEHGRKVLSARSKNVTPGATPLQLTS